MADAAPYLAVHYWRHLPGGGAQQVDVGQGADFAVVQMPGLEAVRLELPAQRPLLDNIVMMVTVVYALGHRDRTNRMRSMLGFAPIDRVPNCKPLPSDRPGQ